MLTCVREGMRFYNSVNEFVIVNASSYVLSILEVISEFKEKIAGLKKAIKELEIKEKEDRELRIADNQIKKATAVIDNRNRETGGRPKRKWFQTHDERTKEKGE